MTEANQTNEGDAAIVDATTEAASETDSKLKRWGSTSFG